MAVTAAVVSLGNRPGDSLSPYYTIHIQLMCTHIIIMHNNDPTSPTNERIYHVGRTRDNDLENGVGLGVETENSGQGMTCPMIAERNISIDGFYYHYIIHYYRYNSITQLQ